LSGSRAGARPWTRSAEADGFRLAGRPGPGRCRRLGSTNSAPFLSRLYKSDPQRKSDFSGASIDLFYHTTTRRSPAFDRVALAYPQIVKLEEIGKAPGSAFRSGRPRFRPSGGGMKTSRPSRRRACIMPRTPGKRNLLALLDHLVGGYGRDSRVTGWIKTARSDHPDRQPGRIFKYITDNALASPWWRKNLRDNNGNGLVDPVMTAVD